MYQPTQANYGRVVGLYEAGTSLDDIKDQVGCSMSTVQRYIRKYNEGGMAALYDGRIRSGRPRKSIFEPDVRIVEEKEDGNWEPGTSVEVAIDMEATSPLIVRNRPQKAGVRAQVTSRKIGLKEVHKAMRLQSTQDHIDMPEDRRSMVIFVNEKVLPTNKDGRRLVWRRRGQRCNSNNVITNYRSGRVTVAAWDWMSASNPALTNSTFDCLLACWPPTRKPSVNVEGRIQVITDDVDQR